MEYFRCGLVQFAMFWFFLWFSTTGECSNILFVSTFGSFSHVHAMTPAMELLSARGHNVTHLTIFEPKFDLKNNVTVLKLNNLSRFIESKRINHFHFYGWRAMQKYFAEIASEGCSHLLTDPNFRRLVDDNNNNNNGTKYDLIILDSSNLECVASLVWLLNSPPLIYYATGNLYNWIATSMGIPTPSSFVPVRAVSMEPLTDIMTFTERFINFVTMVNIFFYRNYVHIPQLQTAVNSIYPSAPNLLDIERNASFVFANSHSASVDLSRPLAPFYVEVGGTHCKPANPLSKELEDFIKDGGDEGFIYFSLGTLVYGADMPTDKLNSFIQVFKRLKQRVIWKFEDDLDNLPSNVKIVKWVTQQDVLGHPKIKAFLTQGGQLSIQEAVFHGVPILGLPVFGEQMTNIKNIVDKGMGEKLNFEFDQDTLYNILMKLILDKSYKDNCLYYSELIRDRPMKAIDTVVYWVEYVIRHKGAKHLRFKTQHLNIFQYFQLDVIGLLLLVLVLLIFILIKIIKMATCIWVYTSHKSKYKIISKKNTKKSK